MEVGARLARLLVSASCTRVPRHSCGHRLVDAAVGGGGDAAVVAGGGDGDSTTAAAPDGLQELVR
jgi:hypothetical protein